MNTLSRPLLILLGVALVLLAAVPLPRPPVEPDDTWAFAPPPDTFSADALLDLRSLNEKVAGETGFVRLNDAGEFVRGDGRPIRFWAVNSDVARRPFEPRPLWPHKTAPDLERHARFLAKRGVNMVRLHRQLSPPLARRPDAAIDDIDEQERDATWRMVAALKGQGIYSTISPYWAYLMKFSPAWGMPGGADQTASGLLFFDPTLQRAYKAWLKKLLAEPNPYTGIPLARDASVALIQIQNEDSLLFWTTRDIRGPQRAQLERLYAAFLARKHGSVERALLAWGGDADPQDAPATGRLALLSPWEMTQERRGGRAKRLADQTEFYARTMFDFNRMIVDYLRRELGVGSLINAGNWRTANAERLNDAERWSYSAADVDAANVFSGGAHKGPNDVWAIVEGDLYASDSILLQPQRLPLNLKQTLGRPMLVTEGAWVMPSQHGAEGPFLVAAYSSLTGIAGYYWLGTVDEGWTAPESANGFMPSQRKWMLATPDTLAGFPAAAFAYRTGLLKRAPPVLVERRTLQQVFDRELPLLSEEQRYDPLRDAAFTQWWRRSSTALPARAYLVGPAQVEFGNKPAAPTLAPLDASITGPIVRAATGEITLDSERGFCRVDAPGVQGVAAHFERGATHQLSDVGFVSHNRFGAALAVALDGQPLRHSKRVLVQYATQSRPTGWRESPARVPNESGGTLPGFRIDAYGHAPWQVVKARLDVTIRNPALSRATVLDMNGMALRTLALERNATELSFAFPESAMYVLLDQPAPRSR